MWALLSDPGHAASFDHLGEAYAPLRRLVEQLVRREYAEQVYAYKSIASFSLTTAPTYQEADGHDEVGITYNPGRRLFGVGYSEWVSPTRNPRHQTVASHVCEPHEVGEVIERYLLRLLLSRQRPEGLKKCAKDLLHYRRLVAIANG
jgi:hypothetical protein